MAGEKADEYNSLITAAEEIASRVKIMRQAAGDRPVTATAMGPAVVGRTDREYRERLEEGAARRGISPPDLEERYLNLGIPCGPPGKAGETMGALAEAGVERYYVQWLEPADVDGFASTIEALQM
jgi:hypothetical protein